MLRRCIYCSLFARTTKTEPSYRVPRFFKLCFISCLSLTWASSVFAAPQGPPQTAIPQDPAKAFNIDFPDSTGGLEKFARELFKSIQHNDSTRTDALTQSLVLQDPRSWYTRVFGDFTTANEGADYIRSRTVLPNQVRTAFVHNLQDHYTEVVAVRFDNSCDDNAADTTFGLLQSRLEPIPLYELRFANGTQFRRLFAFAYVDGAFRFVLMPKTPPSPQPPAPGSRVRQGGNVQAAKLLNRVQPEYPYKARDERLQGTVRLHAIIGKDGSITHLRVLTGKCSLAQSALDAVQRWRYSPTLLNGDAVEVDTTIDVIYSLNR
jgi:TonB family protein